ncbi:hypothetical protein BDW22DRAFT_1485965 [Trametopsis cervina]|nr:hypothetical protein BDW22DRAFT_1485965 [Trametopsis cervina]
MTSQPNFVDPEREHNSATDAIYREDFWTRKDRREFLENRGYRLRRWSFIYSGSPTTDSGLELEPEEQSASLFPHRPRIMGATRLSDGLAICLKAIETSGSEIEQPQNLSKLHYRPNAIHPANHCVPILDKFKDFEERNVAFLVMPVLQHVDQDSFSTVQDVIEFTNQVLLGLDFIHHRQIAHRDCSLHNIMKNTSEAPQTVKYYFIDFSVSVCPVRGYRPVGGIHSRDKEPPEYVIDDEEYNPFALDVFLVGNMLRHEFLDKFTNLHFLQELVDSMTLEEPTSRPNAGESLLEWYSILPNISKSHRIQQLHQREAH